MWYFVLWLDIVLSGIDNCIGGWMFLINIFVLEGLGFFFDVLLIYILIKMRNF